MNEVKSIVLLLLAYLCTKNSTINGTIIPKVYRLTFNINIDKGTFAATENIEIYVKKPTFALTLDSIGLEIEKGSIYQDKKLPTTLEIFSEKIGIKSEKIITKGFAQIMLTFHGNLSSTPQGLHRFVAKNGHFVVKSEFWDYNARRAFPCWDDPHIKSRFVLKIIHRSYLTVLSSTPKAKDHQMKRSTNWKAVFKRSSKMTTSSLSFIVGGIDSIGKTSVWPWQIPVNVYSTVNLNLYLTDNLLSAINCTMHTFNNHLRRGFPLRKLDIVIVPSSVYTPRSGWGLIMIDEEVMNFKMSRSTFHYHIATQWLSNLITLRDSRWIINSLQTWLAVFSYQKCTSNNLRWVDIYNTRIKQLLNKESIFLHTFWHEKFEANKIDKGYAMIEMIREHVGDKLFFESLSHFIDHYAFKTASSDNFWNSLYIIAHIDWTLTINNYVTHSGFPLLTIDRACSEIDSEEKCVLIISQERFTESNIAYWKNEPKNSIRLSPSEDHYVWHIPLSLEISGSFHRKLIISRATARVQVMELKRDQWIMLNPGGHSFCHIQYTPELLAMLQKAATSLTLEHLTSFIFDIYRLVNVGRYSVVELLKVYSRIAPYTIDETIWKNIDEVLTNIDKVMHLIDSNKESFSKYITKIFTNLQKSLEYPNNSQNDNKTLKIIKTKWLSRVFDPKEVSSLNSLYENFLSNQPYNSELLGYATDIYMHEADESKISFTIKLLENEKNQTVKSILKRSLCAVQGSNNTQKVISFMASNIVSNINDLEACITYESFKDHLWEYFENKYDEFIKRLSVPRICLFIQNMGKVFSDNSHKNDIQNFFNRHFELQCGSIVEEILSDIQKRIQWVKKDGDNVKKFLHSLD